MNLAPRVAATLLAGLLTSEAPASDEPANAPVPSAVAPQGLAKGAPWQPSEAPAVEPGLVRKPTRGCRGPDIGLCLSADGRLDVPGAKSFMPEIPGLTPEKFSVRRNGVILRYSF